MGRSVRLVSFCAAAVAVLGGTAVALANAKQDDTKLRRLSVAARIGQDARLYGEESTRAGLAEVTYVVVWRQGADPLVRRDRGASGRVGPAQAIALARKQQTRIVRSLD
jgi:hypothetical protein